jgi:surface protein
VSWEKITKKPIGDLDVRSVTFMGYMFSENTSFNQDLSNWSVGNVTECYSFSSMTSQWTLPQPNFTNCNPNQSLIFDFYTFR